MKNMSSKIECLFGFHNYSDELTKDKDGFKIYLCTICKRHGHFKYGNGYERWYNYDNKGNAIYTKDNYGYEEWHNYDNKGNLIYYRYSNEIKEWFHNGEWLDIKPLNWEYEKYV